MNIKAVTIGDIEGIGLKILIKLWKKNPSKLGKFVLVTNLNILKKQLKKYNQNLPKIKIIDFKKKKQIKKDFLNIYNIKATNNIKNTYKSIIKSYELNKKQFCTSIVTLPLNKEKIIRNIDSKFIGQTELLQKLENKKDSNMFFYSKKIIVTTLTTHIEIKNIEKILKNKKFIYKKIISINNSLKNDFKIQKPKIAIAGINPHAGENGTIGNQEIKYLKPVIKKLLKNKIDICGPFSADTLFLNYNKKKYDCYISTYHDQGLIPFKLISKFQGVNITTGLNLIRTSPDHGTAYDLVNTNKADVSSLANSFTMADKIYKNRK